MSDHGEKPDLKEILEELSYWAAEPHPESALSRILAKVLPESTVVFYRWTGENADVLEEISCSEPALPKKTEWVKSNTAFICDHLIRQKAFAFANMAYSLEDWKGSFPDQAAVFKELHLDPLSYGSFGEVILYNGPHYLGNVSFFRSKGDPIFSPQELTTVQSIIPLVNETMHTRKLLLENRLDPGQISNIAEAINGPVFIVSGNATVVYANQIARSIYKRYPEWIQACIPDAQKPPPPWVKIVPLAMDKQTFWMLLPTKISLDLQAAPQEPWALYYKLPPRLARVAALIMQGLTDKEIAVKLDLELQSVRTYVKELFARIQVHSRGELTAKVFRIFE